MTPGANNALTASNLFTMGAAATINPTQQVPETYDIRDEATRKTRCMIAFEEQLEEVRHMGFDLFFKGFKVHGMKGFHFEPSKAGPNLEEAIDANCDKIYVAWGTMLILGADPVPHMLEVCRCNDAKFPGGTVTMHATTPGKFGKPEGWQPPDHAAIMRAQAGLFNPRQGTLAVAATTEEKAAAARAQKAIAFDDEGLNSGDLIAAMHRDSNGS